MKISGGKLSLDVRDVAELELIIDPNKRLEIVDGRKLSVEASRDPTQHFADNLAPALLIPSSNRKRE